MINKIKNWAMIAVFFCLVAMIVVGITKIAFSIPIEYGAPLGGMLYGALIYGVATVLERSV